MASRRIQIGYVALGLTIALVGLALLGPLSSVLGLAGPPGVDGGGENTSTSTADRITITVLDPDGTELGTIRAVVADEPDERYTGLSDTESLAEDEGMLFVFPEEGTRTFVMRDMDFPLDMLFVGANGRIEKIYHAPVENDGDLTRYRGSAKWVIEVNRGWTTAHDVSVGDRITIEW